MQDKKLYCVLAQHGLGLHNSGRTYLCCHSRKYLEDGQGQQIYLDTHTLEDAWSSPTRKEIQQALEQGIEHPNCQACWDDEHAGKKSRRQYHNDMRHPVSLSQDQPQIFDLKMGNVCNMRCRTCNPEVSSQWYREDWELTAKPRENIDFKNYLVRWRRIPASYSDDNHALWQTLERWIPNAVYIDYYGAEPMLIEKNFQVLQHAVDKGTARRMDLHFSTNGTIWNKDIENLLAQFRRVYFDLSIDDIFDRCGYIRFPSTWDLVGENLQKFLQARKKHQNFFFSVCITINNLNIYYLNEIFDFFAQKDLPCNFNFLHLPWHLNLKVLPQSVKKSIIDKLHLFQMDHRHGHWFQNYWNTHLPIIENFMNESVDAQEKYFQEFHYYTRGLDKTRKQSFDQALPEFAALINPWFNQFDIDKGLSGLSVATG